MPCFFGVCVVRSTASTHPAGGRGRLELEHGNDRATLPVLASSCRFDRDKAKKSVNGSIGPYRRVAEWNRAKLIFGDACRPRARFVRGAFEGSLPFPTLS